MKLYIPNNIIKEHREKLEKLVKFDALTAKIRKLEEKRNALGVRADTDDCVYLLANYINKTLKKFIK